ncbi:MAG: tRNA (adenosine(37)-N6)-threonylcarbamoyltransferase complex ATPase subunit type 1 TsaE [Clostridia bacterium]
MTTEFVSLSEKQTITFAKNFAKNLLLPSVISLGGDLGSGKTTFTKGLALGLGIKEIITSPTFTIMNEYEGEKGNLYHFDMYRLGSIEEAYELGFEEYFSEKTMKGLVVCEWASNVYGILPKQIIEIDISKISENERKIVIKIGLGEK